MIKCSASKEKRHIMCEEWERKSDRDQSNRVWEREIQRSGKVRAKQSEKALRSACCHSNCLWQNPAICVLCKAAISHCILSDGQTIISKADNWQQGWKRQDNKLCLEGLCICPAHRRQLHSWLRLGVLLSIQKQLCWHQAQAWPEKTEWMNDVRGNIFCLF